MKEMLVTSGYSFEGYSIIEYLGMYTGECALGTGFLSTLGAGFADFLGTNSEMYSEKLVQAKDFALKTLYGRARRAGANAIVGLEINYTRFSGDIMGVVATGTAVRTVRAQSPASDVSENELPVTHTNIKSPFRPISVLLIASPQKSNVSVEITKTDDAENRTISGIQADLIISTVFEEILSFNDLYFVKFTQDSKWRYESGMTELKADLSVVERAKSAALVIKKYIIGEAVVDVNADCMGLQENAPDFDSEGKVNVVEILHAAEDLSTASEVMKYLHENMNWMEPEFLSQLDDIARCERIYGNMHGEIVNKLRTYFDQNS